MGLAAGLIAVVGGFVVGIILAIVIAIARKNSDPESSFFLTFFGSAFVTVPVSFGGIFLLIFWWASENM